MENPYKVTAKHLKICRGVTGNSTRIAVPLQVLAVQPSLLFVHNPCAAVIIT